MSLIDDWMLSVQTRLILQNKRGMQHQIMPSFWFDGQASEALQYYSDLFPTSQILGDDGIVVEAELIDLKCMGMNGGPDLKPNPSISLRAVLDDVTTIRHIWEQLMVGGKELMPLQSYPFHSFYGWVQDRYGFSWQLILADQKRFSSQQIRPSLLFCGAQQGKCQQALSFYQDIFPDFQTRVIVPSTFRPSRTEIRYAEFAIAGTEMVAMDSHVPHPFSFNEAVSLTLRCENQQEIDYFWEHLTRNGQRGNCGWCRDPFGVHWQIVPYNLPELLTLPRSPSIFRQMKKIDIHELLHANL